MIIDDVKKPVPSLFGAGLVCLDIIKTDGKTYYYNGGSCGNIAAALSFLGWNNAVLVGKYRDEAAKILNHNLEMLGVQKVEINSGSSATPRIVEELLNGPGERHRFSLTCPECGRELPRLSSMDEKDIRHLDLKEFNVFYSDRASKGIVLLRKVFESKGAWTVYEPNSSRNIKSLIENALDSHIVKFSSEKVSAKTANTIKDDAINGTTVLIVRTMGENGLEFSYRKRGNKMSQWIHLDVHPVPNFVDSAGAGDWCTTGLLYSLVNRHRYSKNYLTKQEVIASLQYGQALAAISCCFIGAQGLIYADTDINEDVGKSLLTSRKEQRLNNLKPANPPENSNNDFCSFCLLKCVLRSDKTVDTTK